MTSTKEQIPFVLEQLYELNDVSYKMSMGNYIIYYKGKALGGIYNGRLFVKPIKPAIAYMPEAKYEIPYRGAKAMLRVDNFDDKAYLSGLFEAMYRELPPSKNMQKNKQ